MRGLDLFSGIGGISVALEDWVRPVAYCEANRFAQAVLLSRMQSGEIDVAPIWDDITTLRAEELPEPIDIIFGGFPCQDLSAAGIGRGLAGERSGLYFEIERLIKEARPAFVFLENVPAIRTRGLGRVVWGLAELGYDLRWTTISAADVGAPHVRKRWFLLAHAHGRGELQSARRERKERNGSRHRREAMADPARERSDSGSEPSGSPAKISEPFIGVCSYVGDATGSRSQRSAFAEKAWQALAEHRSSGEREWPSWLPKPALHRGDHGLLHRVDRTHALGNSVVWQQAREAFKILAGI